MISALISVAGGLLLLIISAWSFNRFGLRVLLIAIPLFLLIILSGIHNMIFSFLPPVTAGGLCGFIIRHKKSFPQYLMLSTVILGTVFTGNYYYLKNFMGTDILKKSGAEFSRILGETPVADVEKEKLSMDMDWWFSIAAEIVPFSSFVYALFYSGISYIISAGVIFRNRDTSGIMGIEYFRVNGPLIFLLIASWAAVIFSDRLNSETVFFVCLNTALISSLLYLVQAIGLMKFFLMKKGLPLYLMPLFFILLMLLGPGALAFAVIIMTGLGVLDIWADFRQFEIKTNNA